MRHFLLTRFNVAHRELRDFASERHGLGVDWLDHRVSIFERVCAPSIAAQTTEGFRWLVFVHPDTPEPYRTRIVKAVGARGEVVWSQTGSVEEVRTLVAGAGLLVTTRLDNDDALARTHLADIQREVERQAGPPYFLNFPHGAQLHLSGVAVHREHRSSPFLSYVENDAMTVWGFGSHIYLDDAPEVRQVAHDSPAWLQFIHDRNLANPRELGRSMRRSTALGVFAIDPALLRAGAAPLVEYGVKRRVRQLVRR